jgi:hypothetical protein
MRLSRVGHKEVRSVKEWERARLPASAAAWWFPESWRKRTSGFGINSDRNRVILESLRSARQRQRGYGGQRWRFGPR